MAEHDRKAPWRTLFLSYPCPTCGAPPDQECRTTSGSRANPPHVARTALAARCPRCGVLLEADAAPGSLCPKHELVRRLEVERATYHQRRNP